MTRRTRLNLLALENRITPAISLTYAGGSLSIRGDNTSNFMTLDTTAPGNITVFNNGITYGPYNLTGNLTIQMGNSADSVYFFSPLTNVIVPGRFTLSLGNGDDIAGIASTFNGGISLDAGLGDDFIQLGQIVSGGATNVFNGGAGNNFFVDFPVGPKTFTGGLSAQNANFFFSNLSQFTNVTISNSTYAVPVNSFISSTVAGNLTYSGSSAADSLSIDGNITGNLTYNAGGGANVFTLFSPAVINGNVSFVAGSGADNVNFFGGATLGAGGNVSLYMGDGDNTYDFTGASTINGSFTLTAGNGVDNVGTFGATVTGNVTMNLGNGANTVDLAGSISGSRVTYIGGGGVDNVTVSGVNSYALYAYLGAGADVFTYSVGSSIASAYLDFGGDTDTFVDNGVSISGPQYILNLP